MAQNVHLEELYLTVKVLNPFGAVKTPKTVMESRTKGRSRGQKGVLDPGWVQLW